MEEKKVVNALSDSHIDTIQAMAYRYDQLEIKDNSHLTNKLFGVDITHEFVQAFKKQAQHNDLQRLKVKESVDKSETDFKIEKFNP